MKNIKILSTVLFLCLGMATMGWCIMIDDTDAGSQNGTDVGILDTLRGWINYHDQGWNSNPTSETNWVNSILDPDVTFQVKDPDDSPIYNTDGAGAYAVNIPPPVSDYFLVKNGNYWALYENSDEMDWGVFGPGLPGAMNIPDSYTVSHVTRFGRTPVPEPATMLLVGFGLLGLAGFGRKKFKK